jgi:hypothetical protein
MRPPSPNRGRPGHESSGGWRVEEVAIPRTTPEQPAPLAHTRRSRADSRAYFRRLPPLRKKKGWDSPAADVPWSANAARCQNRNNPNISSPPRDIPTTIRAQPVGCAPSTAQPAETAPGLRKCRQPAPSSPCRRDWLPADCPESGRRSPYPLARNMRVSDRQRKPWSRSHSVPGTGPPVT